MDSPFVVLFEETVSFFFLAWTQTFNRTNASSITTHLCGSASQTCLRFLLQACSFLYLLMRSNFEFTGAQGCDRVHWQVGQKHEAI